MPGTTPRVEDEKAFRLLVRDRYDDLPPQQQLVADYLIDRLREVPFLSVPELAQKTGASEATVVRFAQRIGYSGFSAMKMDLLEVLRHKVVTGGVVSAGGVSTGSSPMAAGGDAIEPLVAVARQEEQNIARSVEELDREDFRRAATAIFRADHVYTFGLGISSYFAEMMSYLLAQIGLRSTTLSTRFSSPLEQLVALRPTDLLMVFSLPPYSRPTLDMLQELRGRGIPTLAVCDRMTAPASGVADRSLAVRSDNLLFTNSFAAMAVLQNALVTEIAVRHQDHAFEALSKINRILSSDHDVMDDGR